MTNVEDLLPGPQGPLSQRAASLVERLSRGPVPVGQGPQEVPPGDPALAELVTGRVARLVLLPAGPDTALPAAKEEILRALAAGKTDATIAAERGQSVRTVRRHIGEMMADLEAKSRFAAGVAAVRRGWL